MAEEVYVSFETGGDDFNPLGDMFNTDFQVAMRFTTAAQISCPSASTYLNNISETPDGDMTFRIETMDELGEPSGTLVHANATGTIAFADIAYPAWNKCSFTPFDLPAGTYWLTVSIPPQGRNDGYEILCDTNGIGWSAESIDEGASWSIWENEYINYFRIYKVVVAASKFRDEICYKGFPLGFQVRRKMKNEFIFRIKCGTQEKYPYFIPANPQTAPQQAWRAKFTAGIAAAKLLSEAAKEVYRKKAKRKPGQTWHSLFMSWYLWKESHT